MEKVGFDAVLLGFVQGLTEFLPVSSSGHLALTQIFMGMEMPPLSYDLVLHVATACATVVFFWFDIWDTFFAWVRGIFSSRHRRSRGWSLGWAVILGTLVTGAVGVAIKDYAATAMMNSLSVGLGLCVTGVVLLLSLFAGRSLGTVMVKDGLFVGLAQAVALWPGVSRSGMTIAAGMGMGLSKEEAFRFSFLLSLPAIFGATLLQAMEVGGWDAFVGSLPPHWYFGAAMSFVSGLLALALLKRLVISSRWWIFGVYCLALGAATVVMSYLEVW